MLINVGNVKEEVHVDSPMKEEVEVEEDIEGVTVEVEAVLKFVMLSKEVNVSEEILVAFRILTKAVEIFLVATATMPHHAERLVDLVPVMHSKEVNAIVEIHADFLMMELLQVANHLAEVILEILVEESDPLGFVMLSKEENVNVVILADTVMRELLLVDQISPVTLEEPVAVVEAVFVTLSKEENVSVVIAVDFPMKVVMAEAMEEVPVAQEVFVTHFRKVNVKEGIPADSVTLPRHLHLQLTKIILSCLLSRFPT